MASSRHGKFVSSAILSLVFTLAFTQIVEAKSLSGGRSAGRQSSNYSQRQATPPTTPASPVQQQQAAPSSAQSPAAPAAQPQRNRWLGPLTGIAAGLGIGALLSQFGMGGAMGGGIGNLLLIAGLAIGGVFLFRRFFSKPAVAGYGSTPMPWQNNGYQAEPSASTPGNTFTAPPASNWMIPASFDTEAFLRLAKVNFIRLQAAWDQADLDDIREFTTPEMFAEIKLQLNERGTTANHTDVVSVTAELLGIESLANQSQMASVQFSGMMSEEIGTPAKPFKEVWNLIRHDIDHPAWLLAGIQQDSAPLH